MLQTSEQLTLLLCEMAQKGDPQKLISPEERQKVAAIVLKTLKKIGREDLLSYIWIIWNNKLTSAMGRAIFARPGVKLPPKYEKTSVDGRLIRMELSIPLWSRATDAQKHQTILHELAHLITDHEADLQRDSPPRAHGYRWKAAMARVGAEASRTHSVDTTGLKRKTKRYNAKCGCRDIEVTPVQAQKIASPYNRLSCSRCGQDLTLANVSPEELATLRKKGKQRALKTMFGGRR